MEYKKITDLKTIQRILLYALCNFHQICEENNLIYSLFAGTLLGAVRHKGFIPWDDDIDVAMPRDEYEKFVEIMKSGKYSEFGLATPGDENYVYSFGKFFVKGTLLKETILWPAHHVFGAYVDIFVLDNFPDDEKEFDKFYKEIRLAEKKVEGFTRPHSLFAVQHKSVRMQLGRKFFGMTNDISKYVNKVSQIIQKYNSFLTKRFGSAYGHDMFKSLVEKEKFYDRHLYDFEGHRVWGVKNTDEWLTLQYGDYMQLPPVNERISNHDYELLADPDVLDMILKNI